ncbi:MAG TPA: hypothetical protein ENI05_13925 [Porticoccus sp.]|nr:hypothetical protein [Porticoccus sp.]
MPYTTTRLTSKDLVIQFLPHGAAATHIQHLYFHADITGGTFKLRVNGETTAAITMTGTIATDLTAINAALDALDNLTAGDIVATGTVITDITLTAIVNLWYTIDIVDIDQLTGNTTADANLLTEVTTQGSILITLSDEVSQFSWEGSVETTDVTPINQFERMEIAVASAVSFDMSMFKASDLDWEYAIFEGQWGYVYVYQQGKIVGKKHFVMQALLEKVSESFPDHDKIEKELSGMRQGAWIVPPNTVYRG